VNKHYAYDTINRSIVIAISYPWS